MADNYMCPAAPTVTHCTYAAKVNDLMEIDADTIARLRAENERLRAALERMLLEFDFMVERGVIPDVRNDIIFVGARAALVTGGDK